MKRQSSDSAPEIQGGLSRKVGGDLVDLLENRLDFNELRLVKRILFPVAACKNSSHGIGFGVLIPAILNSIYSSQFF